MRGRWNDGVAIKPDWRATESDATFCEPLQGGWKTVEGISLEGLTLLAFACVGEFGEGLTLLAFACVSQRILAYPSVS